MIKTIDLGIARNYVSSWTGVQGIREIVQNCIDQGDYEIGYSDISNRLTMTTYGAKLGLDKLALGNSTKTGDPTTIGQYGEGLKLAFLVLSREGHNVSLKNGDHEEWTISIIPSEDLGGVETLHVTIESNPEEFCGDEYVEIIVDNIDNSDLEEICDENLIVRDAVRGNDDLNMVETEIGKVIFNEEFYGRIYVGGLYVQYDSDAKYGFDFNIDQMQLDRDRKSVNYHELMSKAGEAIVATNNMDLIYECYKTSEFSDEIVEHIVNEDDKDKIASFADKYFKGEEQKVLLVTDDIREFVNLTGSPCEYKLKVEDNDDIREILNEYNDLDECYDTLDAQYEEWKKIKKTLPAQLERFNASKYKQLISVINVLKKRHFTKKRVAFLETLRRDLRSWDFSEVLNYVDESKITDSDIAMEDLNIEID